MKHPAVSPSEGREEGRGDTAATRRRGATVETDDDIIMGMQHRQYPLMGVQFHPESVLTESGEQLLRNFLAL